ncbi:MAG: DUF1553 domain-containing protein [Planctomycetales bacterium]|nr:DUF1553 domain-containing protein [Planctomycetales bacterium]
MKFVLLLLPGLLLAPARELLADPLPARVTHGLQVLYLFDEGSGDVVHDRSGVAPPLDLTIGDRNSARWSTDHVYLLNATVLRSALTAVKIIDAVKQTGEISIEAWVRASNTHQTGPARLVSISADTSNRNVTLGQQGDRFDVRLRSSRTTANGIPSVSTPAGMATTTLSHILYTRNSAGDARFHVDGAEVMRQHVAGDLANWDARYRILVGNEASNDRPWLGEVHLIAIYSRALSPDEVRQNFAAGTNRRARLSQMMASPVDRPIDFVKDVQPIFRSHCFECHAHGNEESGLNLALKDRAMEGGTHGPILEPGNSLASPLMYWVAGVDKKRRMPPEDDPLSKEEVAILRTWIDQGASWPATANIPDPRLERALEHWAFQRLPTEIAVPNDADASWAKTPIDFFVQSALRAKDLRPSVPCEPRTLARRIYFDLVGLPPSPAEVDRFVSAAEGDRDAAIDSLTATLLASRHYGERWARHWLDVVRYADSDGQEADRDRPFAYRYRDFVIRAFNDDMPFDQFVRWQIAGDEYEPDNTDAVVATGFLTAGTHTVLEDSFLEEERLRNRYNELDDVVSTLGVGFLGITLGCARCHDHKYDAISSREYYRLLAAFHSGQRQAGKLPNGEEGLFFHDPDSNVQTTWLFRRGNFYDRELQVKLGFPAIVSAGSSADIYWKNAHAEAGQLSSTLQRRALADWIADVDHGAGPLLARVIVNRIWRHHFGQGLVRTESDFGVRGDAPTHPELLEWLTHDFVAHGWRIKRLHRMILSSATWRQSATFDTASAAIDPENKLLWRMSPQRLEAEILRDAMLAVSGSLNDKAYGPGFKPYIPAEAIVARNLKDGGYPKDAKDNKETHRRSVYMFHKRVVPYPLFQAFDRPDLLQSCGRRSNTTVAPQALALLNDTFVRACAVDFAQQLIAEFESDEEPLVRDSFLRAIGRAPSETEFASSAAFLRSQSQQRKLRGEEDFRLQAIADLCHVLFGLNEFIYVD